MKIERISYKRRNGKVVEYKKHILTEIDEHHYLLETFNMIDGSWGPSASTSFFDGNKVHSGVVCYTCDTVQNKFRLMQIYEGYSEVPSTVLKEE